MSILAAAAAAATSACASTKACTPEEYDLEHATRLTTRELPAPDVTESGCTNPRLEVIGSEAELRELYQDLGMLAADDGAPPGESLAELPAVDFSRERVIVREGRSDEGISWTVADGDTAVVGLLGCMQQAPAGSCAVTVLAVPALVTDVEYRICQAVRCGAPPNRR